MQPKWKRFLEELRVPVEFLHRDEYDRDPRKIPAELPAVFRVDTRGQLTVFLGREDLKSVEDLSGLITAIRAGL
jgi:hypothetical protein